VIVVVHKTNMLAALFPA